jgi:two-component system cell cycle sensor histidine kinase/response regulator CckA
MDDEERQRLRRQAEEKLDESLDDLGKTLAPESLRLLHELKAYRIELEMQNEELRRAREELVQARDRYLEIFHSSPAGLLLLDRQGMIVESNQTFSDLLGIPRQYLFGIPFRSRVVDRDKRIFDRLLHLCSRKGAHKGEHHTVELRLRRRDDSTLEVRLIGLSIPSGETPSLRLSVVDISEEKRMKQRELRSQKLESLGMLAGGIAHDFNNLLTSIMGNITLARLESPAQNKIDAYLDKAEQGTLLARELTKHLFTFATGGNPAKRPVALPALVREAAGQTVQGARHHFEYGLTSDLWTVWADREQLSQVVQDLAINAVQAMPEGGRFEIGGRNLDLEADNDLDLPAGRYVLLTFSDQGTGIAPKIREKIFDPYFSTKREGKGMGLSLSRSIVEGHEGRLVISSTEGQGTTFEIYLPAADEGSKAAEPPSPEIHGGWGRGLVMDDEEDIREVATAMLRFLGYEPATAGDGRAALELYRQAQADGHPFRTVILDLVVTEGLGGEDTLAELRKLDPCVRAIVSSGYSDTPVARRFADYGFQAAIPKPYRVEELDLVLHQVLKAH